MITDIPAVELLDSYIQQIAMYEDRIEINFPGGCQRVFLKKITRVAIGK
jgi:hypothetical protein